MSEEQTTDYLAEHETDDDFYKMMVQIEIDALKEMGTPEELALAAEKERKLKRGIYT